MAERQSSIRHNYAVHKVPFISNFTFMIDFVPFMVSYGFYGQPLNPMINGIHNGFYLNGAVMSEQPQKQKKKRDHLPGKLPAVALKKLPNGWHADGGNLYLLVRGTARSWVFRYTSPEENKRRNMGLGSLEAVSLARARELAKEYRALVKDPQNPIDPIKMAEEDKAAVHAEKGKQKTFQQCADLYIDLHRSSWANKKHAQQWENTLNT